jgi:16S rRNA pseudouridine516 synthase
MRPGSMIRLDRLLAGLGYGSRREIGLMAAAGWITLDGVAIQDAGTRLAMTPGLGERLRLKGNRPDPLPGFAIMLHKPLGVTCSHKEAGRLVHDLLPDRWRARDPQVSTVGRLDKETSGLLLLTDDGALLHRIISPKSRVAKRYRVTLARPLSGDEEGLFAAGTLVLDGEDKPLLPAELQVLGPQQAHLTIHEGRYHQVRRMFAAVGNHVDALHRDRVGGLDLPHDLATGQWRLMSEQDLAAVFGRGA